ncbi:hypothetical protein ACH5RR_015896 [Cinchona calisaya]|uniref:Uncharacterized protein n=1 Tax=Cinchona calisaya TaxID=153742 RepID=A0ABD2ZUE8_9GENT
MRGVKVDAENEEKGQNSCKLMENEKVLFIKDLPKEYVLKVFENMPEQDDEIGHSHSKVWCVSVSNLNIPSKVDGAVVLSIGLFLVPKTPEVCVYVQQSQAKVNDQKKSNANQNFDKARDVSFEVERSYEQEVLIACKRIRGVISQNIIEDFNNTTQHV